MADRNWLRRLTSNRRPTATLPAAKLVPVYRNNLNVLSSGSGGRSEVEVVDNGSGNLVFKSELSAPQTITLTGDVTGSGTGSFATTIPAATVTSAMLRNSAALTVIGRSANSSGVPADIATTNGSGDILRESGGELGFGSIKLANISDAGGIAGLDSITVDYISVTTTDRLLGRDTAGAGGVEELAVSSGIEFTGSGGIRATKSVTSYARAMVLMGS